MMLQKLCWILLAVQFLTVVIKAQQSDAVLNKSIGAKAYSILLNSTEQLESLHRIQTLCMDLELIWKDYLALGHSNDVIVAYENQNKFEDLLKTHKLAFTISAYNIERLVEEESQQNNWQKRLHDDSSSYLLSHYDIRRYHDFEEILQFLNYLKWRYHYIVDLMDIGRTYENRTIRTIKISNPLWATNKRAIWIDAGTHAREWASHSTAMYFINLLTTQYDSDPEIKALVTNFTWYITPVLNPDGYVFTRTNKTLKHRFWRKNRSRTSQSCTAHRCCVGVDLNRNYDFFWNDVYSSPQPCAEDYRGPSRFSENETRAVRNFMLRRGHEIDAFITLHTYSQYWIYPYSHRSAVYPRDVADLKEVALNATKALQEKHGTVYRVGSGADLLYRAPGGSEDWIKSRIHVKYSYLLELRPKESVWGGFVMPTRYLKDIGEETWAGVKVVAQAVLRWNENKSRRRA